MNRLTRLILATVFVIAGGIINPISAQADELPDNAVASVLDTTGIEYVNVRSGPGTGYGVVTTLSAGTDVQIGCWVDGESVTGPYGTTTIWYQLASDSTAYVTDAYLWTSSNNAVTGTCDTTQAQPSTVLPKTSNKELSDQKILDPLSGAYDREKAVDWARDHAFDEQRYEQDCTWFVSQALWAGGMPKTSKWTDNSWDLSILASKWNFPGPTGTAAHADHFKNYMVDESLATVTEIRWSDNTAGRARLGDVIAYDFRDAKGNPGADGIIDHLSIVTSLNDEGYPFVTEHSVANVDRYWSWSINGDDWWENARPGSRAYLIKFNL